MKNKKSHYILPILVLAIVCFIASLIKIEPIKGASKPLYLSDIAYREDSSVGWGSILLDQNYDNKLISVIIDGKKKTFLKGVAAHATSTLIYDISNYKYDYFTAYLGIDAGRGSEGDGVKFFIYTSLDGTTWDLQTEKSPKILKNDTESIFVKINVRDVKFLKLYAHQNGNNSNDHAVYANAKFITEDYEEKEGTLDYIHPLAYYDEKLKENPSIEINEDNELLLLQREFVKNIGYEHINQFANLSDENEKMLSWLLKDVDNLRMYILGGTPDGGNYIKSLTVLSRLYTKYKNDLENNELLNNKWYPDMTYGTLYKKMMISLSLTHSTHVGLWMDGKSKENISDAVKRYQIYKDMHKNGKFVVSTRQDQTPWFEALHVEEMRFVLNNAIDDEEILWLNEYTQKYIDANPNREEVFLQPHPYMRYIWPNYRKPEYHDLANKNMWDKKYDFLRYGVTYKPGVLKLWMNIESGAVCGGISKIGTNIRGVHGTPSSVIGQPGHAALIYYRKTADGKGYWTIDNDISGWALSGKSGALSNRMPLGWGNEEYITSKDGTGLATYVTLSQAALNDFDNYQASRKLLIYEDIYKEDKEKQIEIYHSALAKEAINIDAWYGLIKAYRALNKSEKEFYTLGIDIINNLKLYPLPMYHLTREIYKNIKDPSYTFSLTLAQTKALNEGLKVTSADTIHARAVIQESSYLLGIFDTKLAKFSFDGDDAGKIVLSSRFDNAGLRWEYSLDNKKTWKEISFTADEEHKLKLTNKEIASLTEDTDIYVHIVGNERNDDNIYKIDIINQTITDTMLYPNDLENRVIGINVDTMEWRFNENDAWTSYKTSSPDLKDDKTVEIRIRANETKLASPSRKYTFTKDTSTLERKYVTVSHLSIESVSTEATSNAGHAKNTIDANYNTRWHSAWNGSDKDKFIIIKLDDPIYLSALDYIPAGGGNGKILKGEIYGSLDGKSYTLLKEVDWANTEEIKTAEFEEKEKIQYLKIVGKETSSAGGGSFIAARMFNIYEDTTKKTVEGPTAEVVYSTKELTNKDVIARLVNHSSKLTILNPSNGTDTYTFKENGSFTFTFVDEFGNKGETTASVDWIDKTPPKASISYSKENTNEELTVKLNVLEDVYILGNNNKRINKVELENGKVRNIYFLTDNDYTSIITYNEKQIEEKITTIYNKSNITKVIILDKQGIASSTTYYNNEGKEIDKPDTLKEQEHITINNVKQSNPLTLTVTTNGTYSFKIEDMAGNKNILTTSVDNITTSLPIAVIEYDIMEETIKPVTATIKFIRLTDETEEEAKDITMLTKDGKTTHKFTSNGTYTFKYRDSAGNIGESVATVTWIIDKIEPTKPNKPTTPTKPTTKPTDKPSTSNTTNNNNTAKQPTNNKEENIQNNENTKPKDMTNNKQEEQQVIKTDNKNNTNKKINHLKSVIEFELFDDPNEIRKIIKVSIAILLSAILLVTIERRQRRYN